MPPRRWCTKPARAICWKTRPVGALTIERFLHPVCYQDLPAELLPAALQDSNPRRLVRRVA